MTGYSSRGLHGQVVHQLGERILSGSLHPGTILDLPTVEAGLGVSHTVLREALKVLAAKGLVGARPKHGTFVTPPDEWNMLDADVLRWRVAAEPTQALLDQLAEVRWMVEPASAALAAGRRTEDDLEKLTAALAGMDVASNAPADVVEADLRFHTALLDSTHNVLIASLENVIEQGLRQRDLLVHSSPSASDPVPSHRAVLDAVRAQDASAAETAMRGLLEQASSDFTELQQAATPRRRSGGTATRRSAS